MSNTSKKRPSGPKAVKYTSHISFSEVDKTFRLYTGKSIYAFCISPELTLEHLHWGHAVPPGYDLRYLSQSSRQTHFATVEAGPDKFGGKIVLAAETLEEIQKTWKENKLWVPTDLPYEEKVTRRRIENYSWRVMSKLAQDGVRTTGNIQKALPASLTVRNRQSILSSYSRDELTNLDATQSKNNDLPYPPFHSTGSPNVSTKMKSRSNIEIHAPIRRAPSESNLYELKKTNEIQEHSNSYTTKLKHLDAENPLKTLRRMQSKSKVINKPVHLQTFDRAIGKIGKGGLCVEYSDHGTGDFRTPSFTIIDNFNGSSISPLRYRKHRIYKGKIHYSLHDGLQQYMPEIRCEDENEASTLIVTMSDIISGLDVDLIYVCMHDYDAILRRAIFRNVDQRAVCNPILLNGDGDNETRTKEICGSSKVILKASSLTIDFEAEPFPFHLIQLSGSWGRERHVEETKITQGIQSFGSTRGVSGHQHNPFVAITFGEPNECVGEVRAFSLVYSGNFLVEVEQGEMGRVRVNMGIHPMGLQWNLKQGESFLTPETVMVRSDQGLNGMSQLFHRLFLSRLLPFHTPLLPLPWYELDPPILLNTWEAKYFHINQENILDITSQAVQIGINLICLDDGWFGKRNNDTTSLGDWVINLDKFPIGLKGLVDKVNGLGCRFGLWIEPEMVSEDSALLAAHHDWYLHVPGRPRQLGRNQMVLDLSRSDVRDYLYHSIATLLTTANIEYLKWDMNRPLTEVYSIGASETGIWQTEISHRYVLGVYELQSRIISQFPHVLLENCASGGGRFDPGMLAYSPQIWCSDNTDALVRIKIQYGTSYLYPARCIGAHVSTVPNHITGNTTRLRTRALVAMCGTFGYELDLLHATEYDIIQYQHQIHVYKQLQHIIRNGICYRLWNPFKIHLAAWMYVSADHAKEAVVFAFSVNSDHWSNLVPRLILQGLDSQAEYMITEPLPNNIIQSAGTVMIIESKVPVYQLGVSNVTLPGSILMTAGLPIKFYTMDDSAMFHLTKVEEPSCLLHAKPSNPAVLPTTLYPTQQQQTTASPNQSRISTSSATNTRNNSPQLSRPHLLL